MSFEPTSPGSRGKHAARSLRPKVVTFGTAVVIALIAAIIHYAHPSVPYVHTGFSLLLVGFLILAAGVVLRGL